MANIVSGTWTPTVGGTATYITQAGYYTKIGDLVHVQCNISISAIGTGNTAGLSNNCLPYPVKTGTVFTAPVSFAFLGTNVINVVLHAIPSGSVTFRSSGAAGSGLITQAILTSGSVIWFSGSYLTD